MMTTHTNLIPSIHPEGETKIDESNAACRERDYAKWLRDLCKALKCPPIESGTEADNEAFAHYEAGLTPDEAAEEMRD